MIFPLSIKKIRTLDSFGQGHYHAPRGSRLHNGVDYIATQGDKIKAPFNGTITKIGYAYSGDLNQRYIEITSTDKKTVMRIFYILFAVNVGTIVKENDIIAQVGDISKKYDTSTKKMMNHVHIEIKINGVQQDPEMYFNNAITSTTIHNIPKWLGFIVVPGIAFLLYWLLNRPN